MQFKHQWVAALLFAGSILAANIGLIGAEVSLSQLNRAAALEKANMVDYDSGLSPQLHLKSIKGGKGGVTGGDVHK